MTLRHFGPLLGCMFALASLGACSVGEVDGRCSAARCLEQGYDCGELAVDGCGVVLCGQCEEGQTCGGGGTPNVCGQGSCTPSWQCELPLNGNQSDGCGNKRANAACEPSVVDLSPVAAWSFDENSGATAADSSGNGHVGTVNGAIWTSGKKGSALQFNGTSSYVAAGSIASGDLGVAKVEVRVGAGAFQLATDTANPANISETSITVTYRADSGECLSTVDWSKGGTQFFCNPNGRTYLPISVADADKWWARQHYLAELIYTATGPEAGSWGKGMSDWDPSITFPTHPLIQIAQGFARGYVYAYEAYKDSDPPNAAIYKARAIAGLNWLMEHQGPACGQPVGCFGDFWTSDTTANCGGVPGNSFTAQAGVALLEGYRVFGDVRYRDAAKKAADWALVNAPKSNNRLITFFAEYYRNTGESKYLDFAIADATAAGGTFSRVNEYGYDRDRPSGATHAEHVTEAENSGQYAALGIYHYLHYCYHSIHTRANILLLSAISPSHPDYATVSDVMQRQINNIILRQNPDGGAQWLPGFMLWPTCSGCASQYGDTSSSFADNCIDGLVRARTLNLDDPGQSVLNLLNGLVQFQFTHPVRGINATGKPSNHPYWQMDYDATPPSAAMIAKFAHGIP